MEPPRLATNSDLRPHEANRSKPRSRAQRPKLARIALAAMLATSMMPGLALADEIADEPLPQPSTVISAEEALASPDVQELVNGMAEQAAAALARYEATGNLSDFWRAPASDDAGIQPMANAALPEAFDLRTKSAVTPVKFQNPWGTCWGFAAIAACETSLITELANMGASAGILNSVDLSEKHVAWFATTPLPDNDDSGQGGEGVYTFDDTGDATQNAKYNNGGNGLIATSVFSSGIGPVLESAAPYKGANGVTVDKNGKPFSYSADDDWSLPESTRFLQAAELEESRVLPSPSERDENGNYVYNKAGSDAIKQELIEGRAVSILYAADQSRPNGATSAKYIDLENWAQYTYEPAGTNHAVTIVGWNDAYEAENFATSFDDKATHTPPGDGAWIVKNSWGAKDAGFPNENEWGIDGSGYFYLSYYDQSIIQPETFDLDAERYLKTISGQAEADHYYINQYDYMPAGSLTALSLSAESASQANVFTAEEDQMVRAASAQTATQNVEVTYELYRMNEGATSPTDGELLCTRSETYEYSGYHRIDLTDSANPNGFPMAKGTRFSVVVTQKSATGRTALPFSFGPGKAIYDNQVAATGSKEGSYFKGVIDEGESYVRVVGEAGAKGDVWIDWGSFIEEDIVPALGGGNRFAFDNPAIAAYADPVELPDPEPEPTPDPEPTPTPDPNPTDDNASASGGSSLAQTADTEPMKAATTLSVLACSAGVLAWASATRRKRTGQSER